jgi:hypothetical protein
VTRTLPHDIAKLGQMTAQCVDQLGALTDQQIPRAETTAAPCASALLAPTNRIVGR